MTQLTENAFQSYGQCWYSPILRRYSFTIQTDYDALKWILNLADATGKLVSWRLTLSEMDFDVGHLAKIRNRVAEVFWQLITTGEGCNPIKDTILVTSVNAVPNG